MKKVNSKKSKIINNNKANYNENLVKTLKILGILILLFAIIYVGTAIVRGEIKLSKDDETSQEVSIQNEEILAGSTFNRKEKEYIVLYYNFKNDNSVIYDSIYESYKNSQKELPKLYKVDLSKGFNKAYISDKDHINTKPTKIEELELKNPTLIRIKDKKIIKFITSRNEIQNYINNMI